MSRLSLPKIIRILSLFAITLFITFLSQSKPSTTYAATCYSGECKSPKYACQNNTMCCTGGGCPSYVCVKSGCTFKIGNGCYGLKCQGGTVCKNRWKTWNCPPCKASWGGYCYVWSKCSGYKFTCEWDNCKTKDYEYCGETYKTGGTCGWCTGNPPDDGGGPGGGCSWGSTVAAGSCTQANGLRGLYYRDNPVGEPRFDGGLKLDRNDATVNFDWGSGSPNCTPLGSDNFSVNWTGYVSIPTTGDWTFYITSNDGMMVDVETTPGNWNTIVTDWSDHSARERSGTVALNSGWYGIRVWYYDNNGNAESHLSYSGPGLTKTVIPSANMRTCTAPTSTVQGSKVLMPGNTPSAPVSGQSVFLDGGSETISNPYSLTSTAGSHTVSVTAPGGYIVQSTLCYNRTDCHTTACVNGDASCPVAGAVSNGNSRSVNVPSEGYADLNWHYTLINSWAQALGGNIFANHLVGLRVAPTGLFNARWGIFGRGSVSGSSQENWRAQYYPERNFNLTLNTPIKAPTYADLWKRFGGGASTYSGATLPNADGAYLISGNKTVNGVFNQAGGVNTLVFVDGNLTIDAEIRTAADGTLVFIVSGNINFSESFAGGGPADDFAGGVYIAEGRINTAYDKSAPDDITRQLVVEGTLISLKDTISLDRNLSLADNNTTPSEKIDLTGKYYVLLKSLLGRPKFFYREVPAGF